MMLGEESSPNWVASRANCSLDAAFEVLFKIVQRDVLEANNLEAGLRGNATFDSYIDWSDPTPTLTITRFAGDGPDRQRVFSVQFVKSEVAIRVQASFPDRSFFARPHWNERSNRCRLEVEGDYLDPWEVSQLVLGPLFFCREIKPST